MLFRSVILAEKSSTGYDFSLVKPGNSEEDFNPAYVFVESENINDFKGFCKSEKENLKALGCKKVKLVGYSSDMSYSDFYKEPKNVDKIKHRHTIPVKKNSDKEDNNFGLLLLLIFIILILILCGLCYVYYKRR